MPFGFSRQPATHSVKREYTIGATLGKGGYGEVKLAVHNKTGKEYALKVIEKRLVDYDAQVRRQQLLQTLDHPHVIKMHTWFESNTRFYIVFELARGGELFEHLMDEGRFGEREAQEITIALADAIRYLHGRRIVHRDLKLENVLYRTPPGRDGKGHADCVISDFGLGVVLKDEDEQLFSVCGSAGYSAPEVYTEEGYNRAADVWSFGVIVFALMGGRFPYKNTEPLALAEEARTTKLFFPASWDGISPLAKDFVSRLLVVDPAKRMTAAQACQHPWLTTPVATVPVPTPVADADKEKTPRPVIERRATKHIGIKEQGNELERTATIVPPEGKIEPVVSI